MVLSPNSCLLADLELSSSDDENTNNLKKRKYKNRISPIKRRRISSASTSTSTSTSTSSSSESESESESESKSKSESNDSSDDQGISVNPDEYFGESDEYDPDDHKEPGSIGWGLMMEKIKKKTEQTINILPTKTPLIQSEAAAADELFATTNNIPGRVMTVLSSLLEQDNLQVSQSVSFLHIIRKQVVDAMSSAFTTMLSSSGIRLPLQQQHNQNTTKKSTVIIDDSGAMRNVAKALSAIAGSSNLENSFRPAASIFRQLSIPSQRSVEYPLEQVCSKVIFYREIHTVISLYLSQVYIQRVMNNNNTNSSGYAEGMVAKMINILGKIPHEEMSRDKYNSVGRDALYLYKNVITDVTGPKHSKRLRTPKQQADFCYVIAMLVNDAPIASDMTLVGKATNLVQFASAMGDPAYRLAVHKMACVFNSSYSVYKVLNLDRYQLMLADQILSIVSVRNKSLSERKPRTLTQSVFLYLQPNIRDQLRASGLTSEESSLGTAVKLVSQEMAYEGIGLDSLEEGYHIMCGNYVSPGGFNLKYLGLGEKDAKTVGLSILLTDRIRAQIRHTPFY
uniref:Uncharacterized protein n=4 Tax=unclassified Nimaviridae TaxID=2133791 RepID=A0A1Q3DLN6_9VIRU|nr:wsv282-like protein [Chionoecetes opilio bacilliform virus]GAV93243.1 hypothetical protein SCV_123 [Chionoecetes opilio bacilliform virus]